MYRSLHSYYSDIMQLQIRWEVVHEVATPLKLWSKIWKPTSLLYANHKKYHRFGGNLICLSNITLASFKNGL